MTDAHEHILKCTAAEPTPNRHWKGASARQDLRMFRTGGDLKVLDVLEDVQLWRILGKGSTVE